jgi:aminoglycoside 2'-N-acetyltransferase I
VAVTLVHTAQLPPATLRAARLLVERAFEGGFDEHDWDHALGGLHALVRDGSDLVAHGAVVQRRLLHGGRALRAGYVEAVAVHPRARRRGHASAVMSALEDVVRGGYDLGALSATDGGARLYAGRGWQQWRGTTWALTPSGRVPTPEDDDSVFVLPGAAELDVTGEVTCDWRDGDLW